MTVAGHNVQLAAVVFDMDGVLLDSEEIWHEVRRDFVALYGGRWTEGDQRSVMGHNSRQWAEHIRDRFAVPLEDEEIVGRVVAMIKGRYERRLPVVDGAVEAVQSLAAGFRLAVASSSPLELIDGVLGLAGLSRFFSARVSSDEVPMGKPAPDVYEEACRRLEITCARAAAVEDSLNGIRAARDAGMRVVAIPNPVFPPPPDALRLADRVIPSIKELTAELVRSLA